MLRLRPPRISAEPVRLTDNTEQRGTRAGMSLRLALVFGLVFVAAGSVIGLIGLRRIAVPAASVHAPLWILTSIGASQVVAGAAVWAMAWRQAAADRRRQSAAARYADEPALADYPWDPSGFEVPRWHGVARFVGGAAFFTIFLSVFNYWAFVANGGWVVGLVTGLFDVLTLGLWVQAVMRVGRALKFDGTRITFDRFPLRRTMPIIVRWQPSSGIRTARRGSFTLRCVQESFEERGRGTNRSRWLVREQGWAAALDFDEPHDFEPGEDTALTFDLPPDAPPTSLAGETPVFWELVVTVDLPGLDFVETYLVPIY